MSETARVTSVDAIKEFRETLVIFCENVRAGLCANEMESRHVLDWLLSYQPGYWARQLRQRQEELAQAQADLHRLKLQRAQGMRVDDIEQKTAVERAKERVDEAEEKLVKVRRWGRAVQQAIDEYQARARQLADLVEGNPPANVLFLDRVIDSLESYLRIAPPSSAQEPVRDSAPARSPPAVALRTDSS
jgi:exonuclease VII large subunit